MTLARLPFLPVRHHASHKAERVFFHRQIDAETEMLLSDRDQWQSQGQTTSEKYTRSTVVSLCTL